MNAFADSVAAIEDEALDVMVRDPAPERRLQALRFALTAWRSARSQRRLHLELLILRVVRRLDFFARLELAGIIREIGAAPRALLNLLSGHDAVLAEMLAPVAPGDEGPDHAGLSDGAGPVPVPRAVPVLPPSFTGDDLIDLARCGAVDDLAVRLAIRSGRTQAEVRSALLTGTAEGLAALVREAGCGPALLTVLAALVATRD